MSKRLISRLSIILLSSLMVIQSCQTPNIISESKKFSVKSNGDAVTLPINSASLSGEVGNVGGLKQGEVNYCFSDLYVYLEGSAYEQSTNITKTFSGISFSSSFRFNDYEKWTLNANFINSSLIEGNEITSQLENSIYQGPQRTPYSLSGTIKMLPTRDQDNKLLLKIKLESVSGSGTIMRDCDVISSMSETMTLSSAVLNLYPNYTSSPSPTPTSTILPTLPPPTPTLEGDCDASPTRMENSVNISNNLVNNLNPKFSVKNISTDILNNNIQIRNILRNELNSLYNDNLFSIEKSFNYSSLNDYTNKIKALDFDLDFYLNDDENIIEALDVIADKSQIYSEVATSSFNESEKSKFLTSLLSSITSDAKTINLYYQKQLNEDISTRTELSQELPEVQEDFQKLIVLSLIKQGILNPYTLEINSNNSFKTKSISSDISSLFNTAWTNIKSQYNTASNFILQLETPVLDKAAGLIFDNWDQIKAADPDGAKKILENLRDASIIAPSGPEDFLPCGKGLKAAKSVGSHISKPISDAILKELGDVLKRNPDLNKKIKDMYKKVLGLKPSGSSGKLGTNIFNAPFNHPQKGKPKPTGWQSHHIVEESKDNLASQKSRELLENNGINYKTDAYNGVNLPTRSTADKSPDFPKVINHKETFNPKYADAVYNRLNESITNAVTPEQKKKALQNELLSITNDLLNGKKFWSSK